MDRTEREKTEAWTRLTWFVTCLGAAFTAAGIADSVDNSDLVMWLCALAGFLVGMAVLAVVLQVKADEQRQWPS